MIKEETKEVLIHRCVKCHKETDYAHHRTCWGCLKTYCSNCFEREIKWFRGYGYSPSLCHECLNNPVPRAVAILNIMARLDRLNQLDTENKSARRIELLVDEIRDREGKVHGKYVRGKNNQEFLLRPMR